MKKILVIRFSSLGDIALTTPVYRNIKEYYKDSFLCVLTKKAYRGLLEANPYIDEVMPLEDSKNVFELIKKIRSEGFDLIIDLHSNLRSSVVRFFGGSARSAVYKKDALARRLFVMFKKSSPSLQKHTIDRYLGVLESLGIPAVFKKPEIYPKQLPCETAAAGKKILFIQTSFLGDIVLSVPALKAIKAKHQNTRLHLLTTPQGGELLSESSFLDNLIIYDKKLADRALFSYLKLIYKLRREKYDLAIIPHRSFRSALIAWLSGIKERVGFDNSQGKVFLSRVFPFQWSTHDLERNYLLLKPLGIELSEPEPWLAVKQSDSRCALDMLKLRGVKDDDILIGVNPGSIWETKKWPAENFARLLKLAEGYANVKFLFFGGKNDLYLEKLILGDPPNKNAISFIGQTKINELITLIALCKLFVTNDSGPMHIAVGLGVQTIAIFGPTTRGLGFFPYGDSHKVFEVGLPCRPCGLHGGKNCPKGHFDCMRMIKAEAVFDELKKRLKL